MLDEEKAMKLKGVPNVPVSYVPVKGESVLFFSYASYGGLKDGGDMRFEHNISWDENVFFEVYRESRARC